MNRLMAFLVGGSLLLSVSPCLAQAPPGAAPPQRPRAEVGVLVQPPAAGTQGAVVAEVTPNSPAAKAGLQPGDVITKIGSQDVRRPRELMAAIAQHKPGDKVELQVLRDGQQKKLTVTLAERQAQEPRAGEGFPAPGRAFPGTEGRRGGFLGVQTAEPRPGPAGATGGATVAEVVPDSPAAKAGLKEGDVILSVNGQATQGPEALREAIRRAGPGKEVNLKVMRGNQEKELTARLEAPPRGQAFPFGQGQMQPMIPPMMGGSRRLEELERKVDRLERRIQELEQQKGQPPRSQPPK